MDYYTPQNEERGTMMVAPRLRVLMHNRWLKIVVLFAALVALAKLAFFAAGRELIASGLTIHAPKQGWRSVTIDGDLLMRAEVAGQISAFHCVRVSPLIYGPHICSIVLANGKIVNAEFFHSDTGVVRQVDIYLGYNPISNRVSFRETNTRYMIFPGITRTVFTGTVAPEATRISPYMLAWI